MNEEKISYSDFSRLDIRIGTVVSAEKVLGADKLLKLQVDLGEEKLRTLVAGIALFTAPEDIIGKQIPVFANLEHRVIFGILSEGMMLAASAENNFSLLQANGKLPNGSRVK